MTPGRASTVALGPAGPDDEASPCGGVVLPKASVQQGFELPTMLVVRVRVVHRLLIVP